MRFGSEFSLFWILKRESGIYWDQILDLSKTFIILKQVFK
ncbi:hypothetical protein LEP1GSC081_1373 [Leptospira kirschneri str. H1]|uniref:Uncharacterized protein n=1 Tax=Leptospira kirschneri str. H1 TaxID=1049966 RepID=A0A0E2B568_9LEPT|nr:hypothetical protein LEP1GSC081_1373 [Leptospira kirschneri str. H1]